MHAIKLFRYCSQEEIDEWFKENPLARVIKMDVHNFDYRTTHITLLYDDGRDYHTIIADGGATTIVHISPKPIVEYGINNPTTGG